MREERCGNCRFWEAYEGIVMDGRGDCVRYPPEPTQAGGCRFPVTLAERWCDEHTPLPGSPSGGDSGEDGKSMGQTID